MAEIHFTQKGFLFTSDPDDMKPDQIHQWLSTRSYWAQEITPQKVEESMKHSFCIGILNQDQQIGFGRLVTDYSVFAYLADIFVLEEYQGQGLGKILIQSMLDLPWMKSLRKIMLATLDAQSFYQNLGFSPLLIPDRYMEINRSELKKPPLVQKESAEDRPEPKA